jgi:hypothetical protein
LAETEGNKKIRAKTERRRRKNLGKRSFITWRIIMIDENFTEFLDDELGWIMPE